MIYTHIYNTQTRTVCSCHVFWRQRSFRWLSTVPNWKPATPETSRPPCLIGLERGRRDLFLLSSSVSGCMRTSLVRYITARCTRRGQSRDALLDRKSPFPRDLTERRELWFACWRFTSWYHLRSYQGGYRLVTKHTHDGFIVLSHWETRLLAP